MALYVTFRLAAEDAQWLTYQWWFGADEGEDTNAIMFERLSKAPKPGPWVRDPVAVMVAGRVLTLVDRSGRWPAAGALQS